MNKLLILAVASLALSACVPAEEPLPNASSILVRHNEATALAQSLDSPGFYSLNQQTYDSLYPNRGKFGAALCDPQFNRRKLEVYAQTVQRMRQAIQGQDKAMVFKPEDIATLRQVETEAAFFCRIAQPVGHHHHSRPRRST